MPPASPSAPPASLAAAWRLRWRVLRRERYGALEALLLAGVCGLAWMTGGAAAARDLGPDALRGATGLLLAGLLLALARRADALLHRAPELVLLIPAGLSARALVRLRALELVLAALAGLLPLACGLVAAGGGVCSPLLGAALVALAPTLAALAVLLARALRVAPAAGALLLAALLAAALAAGWPLQAACAGELRGALPLLVSPLPALLALELWGPLGQARALDRAARRPLRARAGATRALERAGRPLLGRPAAALLARDLTLLARGGFARGAVVLLLLPAGLLAVRAAAGDPTLEAWQLLLAGLLTSGMLASGAGWLFGVDFPRARGVSRELERVQPLRGGQVLRARLTPALLVSLALLGGVVLLLPAPPRGPAAAGVLLRGALLALAVVHDACCQGLQAEGSGDPTAGAAAYPFRSATLVIVLAAALCVHPLGILVWPLLGWPQAARPAARAWERGEVPVERRPSA